MQNERVTMDLLLITYLFSALAFSFSTHALIKELIFSVSTFARATSKSRLYYVVSLAGCIQQRREGTKLNHHSITSFMWAPVCVLLGVRFFINFCTRNRSKVSEIRCDDLTDWTLRNRNKTCRTGQAIVDAHMNPSHSWEWLACLRSLDNK